MHPEFSTNNRGAIIIYGKAGPARVWFRVCYCFWTKFVGFMVYRNSATAEHYFTLTD